MLVQQSGGGKLQVGAERDGEKQSCSKFQSQTGKLARFVWFHIESMLKPLVQDTYHWRAESEIFSTLNEFWGFHQTTDHKNKFESGGEKLGFIENVSPTHKWCKGVEDYTVLVSEHFFWIGFLLTQPLFTWKIPLAVFPPAMKLSCSAYIPLPELKNSGDHSDCFSFGQILSASCILLLLDSLTLIHQQTFFLACLFRTVRGIFRGSEESKGRKENDD